MQRTILVIFLGILLLAGLIGCGGVSQQAIKFDEEYHKAMLDTARVRIKYVSCDIGLIDGLGLTSPISFPIKDINGVRAIINSPMVTLTLVEMRDIAEKTLDENGKPYWNEKDYALCKVEGLGFRAASGAVIDALKLIPQLAPYLAMFGM